MSTIASQPPAVLPEFPQQRRGVVMQNISWDVYQSLLRDLDGQHLSLTYDRGTLEIMPPSPRHERIGEFVGRLVETLTLELGIPIVGLGSATWYSKIIDRGLEADKCYYVARAEWAAGREVFDLNIDPPPDLAIEVDITSSSLDKEDIYRALGVPELWRYGGGHLAVRALNADLQYETMTRSLCFPMVPLQIIEDFVARRNRGSDTALMLEFQGWVRATLNRAP
jgi:Uma2 family endonuclease